MNRLEHTILAQGGFACGIMAAALAIAAAIAGGAGARMLGLRCAVLSAMFSLLALLINRHAAAVARRRHLDPTQRAGLLAELQASPMLPVTVSAIAGDDEALTYARELARVLKQAQWPVTGVRVDAARGNASNTGLMVAIKSNDEPPPLEAVMLFFALERVGLSPAKGTSPRLPDQKSLELYVGRRV